MTTLKNMTRPSRLRHGPGAEGAQIPSPQPPDSWGPQIPTLNRTPWIEELFEGAGPLVKSGYAELPVKPGLGVTLNEKIAAQHPYKPTNRPEYHFGDGSVTDQ